MVLDMFVRVLTGALLLAMPVGLFHFLRSHLSASWRFIRIGAATFVGSQFVHVPLNSFILAPLLKLSETPLQLDNPDDLSTQQLFVLALVLGLSAGVCEEVSRYVVYRYWIGAENREWKTAITFGRVTVDAKPFWLGLPTLQPWLQ